MAAGQLRVRVVLVAAVLLAAACSGDGGVERGEDGQIVEAGKISVFGLTEGDCVAASDDADDRTVDIESVEAVPCDEPHSHEVIAVVDLVEDGGDESRFGPGAVYPGEAALGQEAEAHCADQFTTYVGTDYLESDLFFTYLVPSVRSWQDQDKDRDIICLAMAAGETLRGSVKDSGR